MSAKAEEREQQQNKEHSKIVKDLERKVMVSLCVSVCVFITYKMFLTINVFR
jgi:hypothetical protein